MPANLPPEAKSKLAKYSEAKTIEEKIRALEEFLSSVPKHKGTENIRQWARRRLAELREELEIRRRKRGGGGPKLFIEKAEAAQVVMLGPPNSGKSSLLAALTNAEPEVSPYPFTTQRPMPGMLNFEDIQFQLIDTPPLVLDRHESQVNSRILGLARNADVLMLVVGLDEDKPNITLNRLASFLAERGILITKSRGLVRIQKTRNVYGIKVVGSGKLVGFTEDDLRRLLSEYRIYNAIVEIEGAVTLDDVEAAIFTSRVYKPTIVVLTKLDLPGAREKAEAIKAKAPSDIPVIPVSTETGEGLDLIGPTIFRMAGIIRVYTKQPNKEPDPRPLIVPQGTTVIEAAERIHSRLARNFKYAKVWGPSAKYPGQRVGGDHVLQDKDILEIHA